MRARYPNLQVRSDNEEALKHVLKDACEKVHLEYSNTRFGKLRASNGRGEKQCQDHEGDGTASEKMQFSRWVLCFSIKHPLFCVAGTSIVNGF